MLTRIEIGNIRFDKEVANRISTSYEYTSKKIKLLTELFYNRIQDYIYLRSFKDELDNKGAHGVWIYEQTNAEDKLTEKRFEVDISTPPAYHILIVKLNLTQVKELA